MSEGDVPYAHLTLLRIAIGGTTHVCDALLCPNATIWGYPTKLLLAQRVGNPSLNWNAQPVIFGRTWETWSWGDVPSELPIIEIFLAHLGALK